MKIYYCTDFDALDPAACLPLLPPARAETVRRLRQADDRRAGVAAYLLLDYALRARGQTLRGNFRYGAHGKPYFADLPGLFFNLSHTRGAVACCVGKVENGVDMQAVGACSDAVARRVFCPNELRLLEEAEDKPLAFTRLWTRKEACAKLRGTGIAADLRQIDTTALPDIYTLTLTAHVLSACGDAPEGVYPVSLEDLLK